jgi:hypothetical protein
MRCCAPVRAGVCIAKPEGQSMINNPAVLLRDFAHFLSRLKFANRLLLHFVLLVPLCALTGCTDDEAPDYRYRLTVEVQTPEGLRSGSSVIQVRQRVKWRDSKPKGVRRRVHGEAVAVDLPNGSTLFALLRGEDITNWPETIMARLAPEVKGEPYIEKLDDMLALKGEVELPRTFPAYGPYDERSAYPMLVTFADIADPTSVQLVDPDDLAATFGEGTALKRITVQITDAPVTAGIEKRLGWMNEYKKQRIRLSGKSGAISDNDLANNLGTGYFSTGE